VHLKVKYWPLLTAARIVAYDTPILQNKGSNTMTVIEARPF
jgi:hypothetical protein